MNIIVTNKYKDLIYNTNIEVLKELNGVFKVREIVNSFNSIFYKKIIIDATALEDFPKESVLKELASSFDMDKLILFLPPDNPPPRKFLSFLISINLFNFTDNSNGLLELVKKSNTFDDVKDFSKVEEEKVNIEQNNNDLFDNTDVAGRIVLGFKSVTDNSYSTEIIYSIKRTLEEKYQKKVLAVEIDKRNFVFYTTPNMYSINKDKVSDFLKNNLSWDVVLIDLDGDNYDNMCNDVIYLVNPSLYTINKLMINSRDAFIKLKGKKIVFVNSLLNNNDINQFAKEAAISVYYNLPPINDRIHNQEIDKLLGKLGIVEESNNKQTKRGLFDIFK